MKSFARQVGAAMSLVGAMCWVHWMVLGEDMAWRLFEGVAASWCAFNFISYLRYMNQQAKSA